MKKLFFGFVLFSICSIFEQPFVGAWTVSVVGGGVPVAGAGYAAYCDGTSSTVDTNYDFTSQSELWGYWLLNVDDLPTSVRDFFRLSANGVATARMYGRIDNTGTITLYNGADNCSPSDTVTEDTTYHVWIYYKTDGNYNIEFNTSGTKSGDGTDFCSSATGDSIGTAGRFYMRVQTGAGTFQQTYDKIMFDDASIGSSPSLPCGGCIFTESFDGSSDCGDDVANAQNCDVSWTNDGADANFTGTGLE